MSKILHFILNPEAGSGKAAILQSKISGVCQKAQIPFELTLTKRRGHAKEIAKEICLQGDPHNTIVSVGGDGTLHEVGNGILEVEMKLRRNLGIIAAGTGNDYLKMFKQKNDLEGQILEMIRTEPTPVDSVQIKWQDSDGRRKRTNGLNLVGIGFDALAAARSQSYKKIKGAVGYVFAVVSVLGQRSTPEVTIETKEDNGRWAYVYKGEHLLSNVGIGRYSGGVFNITPEAIIDDGLMDYCCAPAISIGRILFLIPKVIRGKHLGAKAIKHGKSQEFRISSMARLPFHVDGEVKSLDAKIIEVKINPASLNILGRTL